MKARIVDVSELKKTPAEIEAEALLSKLTDGKAIEVTPDGTSTRTIRRAFSKAAQTLGVDIRFRTKDDRMYVQLKAKKD